MGGKKPSYKMKNSGIVRKVKLKFQEFQELYLIRGLGPGVIFVLSLLVLKMLFTLNNKKGHSIKGRKKYTF